MLVLTRKKEQKIHIGTDIKITVLKIQGNQVSIGIEAPKNMQIVREELVGSGVESRPVMSSEMSNLR